MLKNSCLFLVVQVEGTNFFGIAESGEGKNIAGGMGVV